MESETTAHTHTHTHTHAHAHAHIYTFIHTHIAIHIHRVSLVHTSPLALYGCHGDRILAAVLIRPGCLIHLVSS